MSTFYLGALDYPWLERTDVPLFISRRRFERVKPKSWRRAAGPWALDSGAFSELSQHGRFLISAAEYAALVGELCERVGRPDFVAPMDHMCEPFMLARTGRTVADHIAATVDNFCELRALLGALVIPVLQGFGPRDYERCAERYKAAGVDLESEPRVGLGSVCRRSNTREGLRLVRYLVSTLRLRFHGFGLKASVYRGCRDLLASADSMAWSYQARKQGRDGNSLSEALAWRSRLLNV